MCNFFSQETIKNCYHWNDSPLGELIFNFLTMTGTQRILKDFPRRSEWLDISIPCCKTCYLGGVFNPFKQIKSMGPMELEGGFLFEWKKRQFSMWDSKTVLEDFGGNIARQFLWNSQTPRSSSSVERPTVKCTKFAWAVQKKIACPFCCVFLGKRMR